MPPIDLEPSDEMMAARWHMHTEFMLNRVDSATLKRLVDDIKDGRNFVVNEEGNIVEDEEGYIERNKEELNKRIIEKVESSQEKTQIVEDKLSKLKQKGSLPGFKSVKRQAKIEVLEELVEELDPENE